MFCTDFTFDLTLLYFSVGKRNVEAFLSKKELEILFKTRFAFKVVLFQKTFKYTNAINIYYS
jgi:hypothetical protein